MPDIKVKLGKRSYTIKIGYGIVKNTGKYLAHLGVGTNGVIITNPRIKHLCGNRLINSLLQEGFRVHVITVSDSEKSKSHGVFSNLISRIAKYDRGKKPFIIAFGGGVIGDLAGFVAAVYRRGVPLIQIPTTLLAQVDSSIGGKVAIDLPIAKNLVGAFYQPKIVISDVALLKTLPKREIGCGLSEIIKYSVISSRRLFDFLSENIVSLRKLEKRRLEYVIRKCSAIKSKVVSLDEKETRGIRALLNYGHTIGHAIEAASGYRGIYNHGEAVAIGMIAAARISNRMGMLSAERLLDIVTVIKKAGLPTKIRRLKISKISNALCHDKKFAQGKNRFVLPLNIGRVKLIENIPNRLILEVIEELVN